MRTAPLIIAHRGAPLEVPENTLASFDRAIELGADGLECDVRLTRDRIPVLMHDEDLARVAGRRGRVSELTLDEIQSIDLSAYHPSYAEPCRVPTLAEALAHLSNRDLQLVIEVKGQRGRDDEAARAIDDILENAPLERPPILSSSSAGVLAALYRRCPDRSRAFIVTGPFFSFLQPWVFAKLYRLSGMHVVRSCLNTSFVRRCHARGIHCYTWTINDDAEVKRACALVVDGIITDDVAGARRARD